MGVYGKTFHQFNTHQAIDHQTFVFPNGVTVSGGNQTMNCNYQVGNVDVFVRGIKMAESEFTADDGTSVSIPVATLSMTAGDEITIIGRKYPTADIMNSGAVNISGGQVNNTTMNNSTLTNASMTTGTLGSSVVFPRGVITETNYLIKKATSNNGSSTNHGYHPSSGNNIVFPFDTILANTTDSAFTQNFLTVSSGYFTLNTGYYNWKLYIPAYGNDHVISHGLRTYGGSDGSGTTLGNIATDDVNFMAMGTTYNKSGYASHAHSNEGIVKVTSNTQKYCVTFYFETSNYAGFNNSSVFQVSASNPQNHGFIRVDKIGAI